MSSVAESVLSHACVELSAKIEGRTARVGIIGLGYVGLPLALLYSRQLFPVIGFDIDPAKIEMLTSGESYLVRIPNDEIQQARRQGWQVTADFSRLSEMDVVIICVPTPLDEYRSPDLSYIVKTAHALAPFLREQQLVVLESTTYPGTTQEVLVPILEKENPHSLLAARDGESLRGKFFVAFSPEREDPGNTEVERHSVPKVVGGLDATASDLACALYGTVFTRPVRVSSPAVAEMTKLLENIYRCVNIALVNELKLLCLRMGIDIWEVIDAAKTKPFGFQAFYPGPGLGGHCIPIDPFYLSWKAREFDFQTRFIELAGDINTNMPYHIVESVQSALNEDRKTLKGSRILMLGLSYKRDIDDLRESPALTILELLQNTGAEVSYNDPFFPTIGKGRKYDLDMRCAPLENLEQYDCLLIVTDHSSYDYERIARESKLVVDTRNATKGMTIGRIVRC